MKIYKATFATEKNPLNYITFKLYAINLIEAVQKLEKKYPYSNITKVEEIIN